VLRNVVVAIAHQDPGGCLPVHGRLHPRASPARVAVSMRDMSRCRIPQIGRMGQRPMPRVSRSAQARALAARPARATGREGRWPQRCRRDIVGILGGVPVPAGAVTTCPLAAPIRSRPDGTCLQ
jgi:hypothetical protein